MELIREYPVLPRKFAKAFTLSELLIALAILGVIATFTIPKVLQAQQNNQFKAIGKETAGMMSDAFMQYKLQNTVQSTMESKNLTPFLNYVVFDTASQIDREQTLAGSTTCDNTSPCIRLHNGSKIMFW